MIRKRAYSFSIDMPIFWSTSFSKFISKIFPNALMGWDFLISEESDPMTSGLSRIVMVFDKEVNHFIPVGMNL